MKRLSVKTSGRRLLSLTVVIMLLGALLTGCTGKGNAQGDSHTTEGSEEKTQGDSVNAETKRGEDMEMHPKEHSTIQAKRLEVNTRLMIDYSIYSYAPVQNFSYNLLSQNLDKLNPVLSPVSAYLAISMAGCGAEGETLEEFRTVLGSDMACLQDDLMNRLPQDEEELQVLLANSAWLDDDLTVLEHWLSEVYSFYDADVYQAELTAEETREDINLWVKQNTEGMIQEFLSEQLNEDVALVLFDTVYFQGKWEKPFAAANTREREFTLDSGEVIMAETMSMPSAKIQYFQSDLAEGVVLPYVGDAYSFVAVKPTGKLTVRELYDRLTLQELMELIGTNTSTVMDLNLPKFEITFDQVLNESLQNMGLQRAFDMLQADFTGISNDPRSPLYIGLVRQKAVFRLDEEGTEASVATEVELLTRGMSSSILSFDRPFLYMIIENESQVPLFMGIMDNPAEVQEK
ncbi:MAG: serpin family protein [Acetatifactor sp.]|nr:serpin family protein [Acetatifactor sp.]